MLRHLDLFSGIGGFALACRRLDIETLGFCEIDPFCQKVLAKHWPEVPIHDDIRTLTGDLVRSWGGCDLVTGGFPCQPFSVAGQRRGANDDRHLWPEMARLIDELRPAYVLGENVPGLIKVALDDVCLDLEARGYAVRPIAVPAVGIDAPHKRERIWIMAHTDTGFSSRANETLCPRRSTFDVGREDVADAERLGQQGSRESWDARDPAATGEGQAAQSFDGRERYIWPTEPRVGRVAHGVSNRVDRLKGLGNAIVPQVAYELLRVMTGATA